MEFTGYRQDCERQICRFDRWSINGFYDLIFNPFVPEFMKWIIPSLNLDTPTDANRNFSLKSKNRLANCVDPVETAPYKPSHLDLYCLHMYLFWSAGYTGSSLQ